MIERLVNCAFAVSALGILLTGCSQSGPSSQSWADDVHVTGSDWTPLPETIGVSAGHSLDLTLSFKWTREAGMMQEVAIRPPAEWRVAASVLTEGGELAVPRPINSRGRELYDISRVGTERLQRDRSLVWTSPEPPKEMAAGRRYLWGRVEMPKEPGTYRLILNLYPTVTADPTVSNPEFGPVEEIYSTVVHVNRATTPPPSVVSRVERSNPGIRQMLANERSRR